MEPDTAGLFTTKEAIPRLLPLEGVLNAHELGGYPVMGRTKRVKGGLLYRSGELYGGTEGDRRFLENLGIKTVVDFRSEEERKAFPEIMPKTVERVVELPIDAGNLMGAVFSADGGWTYPPTAAEAVADMEKLYTALPEEAIPKYRVLFSLLADPENTPLLFHCTAGKDRTGLAAALLLHALGADIETIFVDYLFSAVCLRSRYQGKAEVGPNMIPYWTVQESYLKTAFEKIKDYGGMDRYISKELEVDVERLRSLYTK
jgi:protein-tyrosine phosphatase